ncbi:unnamed protein product [Ostreobium quekettii]|uniref:ABM domain-containing protein n=1 Tax=Ostreobium quekettii TaxID=121088 RepID=A0A8S1J3U1_9CHLO|nr:unnamed protein product [Ostreobium quekettii]
MASKTGGRVAWGSQRCDLGSRAGCQGPPAGPRRARLQVCAAVKKSNSKNIVCSKTLIVKQEHMEKVKEMCLELAEHAKGEMNDRKNGILGFDVMADQFEDGTIHFWERYTDNQRLNKFNASPKFMAFMEGVSEYLERPVGLALYEYNEGQIGNSCVQEGPKGEGGLDDATGAGLNAGARMSQTANVVNLGDMKRGDEGDAFGMDFKFPWQKDDKDDDDDEKK